jgi:hypothetical protein
MARHTHTIETIHQGLRNGSCYRLAKGAYGLVQITRLEGPVVTFAKLDGMLLGRIPDSETTEATVDFAARILHHIDSWE